MTSSRKVTEPNLSGNIHLEPSALNLLSLREHSRNEIYNALSKVEGKSKHLIWDINLLGSLNYIITTKMLNDLGITVRGSLDINCVNIDSHCDSIIYLVYSNEINMKTISKQIINHSKTNKKHFYLLLIPGQTFLCDRILQNYGMYGLIRSHNIFHLHIEWFPIDSDVISLQKKDCLKQLLNGNITSLTEIADSLFSLQTIFGGIPVFRAKGEFACSIVDIMKRLIDENIDLFDTNSKQLISECVIIDRTVDMITPCVTPKTYEGLLDEIFGIKDSIIKVNKAILGKYSQRKRGINNKINIVLNSSDMVYEHLRDKNFRHIGNILSTMAQYIRTGYNERYELHSQSVKTTNIWIKTVFKKLYRYHGLVEQHVHLADYLANKTVKSMKWRRKCQHEFALLCNEQVSNERSNEDYLEELIGKGDSIENVLKFMILLSLTSGGINEKKYELIKRDIIQTYGINYLFTLELLEKYSLILKHDTFGMFKQFYTSEKKQFNCNWKQIKKSFSLIKSENELDEMLKEQKDKDESKAKDNILGEYDINLIGNGYSPLSVRLIEGATRPNGWKSMQKELKQLKGKTYLNESMVKMEGNNESNSKKIMLVFFVGGVTHSEISAIRMLESRENTPWKFIVASTNVSNGNHIMNAFIDQQLK